MHIENVSISCDKVLEVFL